MEPWGGGGNGQTHFTSKIILGRINLKYLLALQHIFSLCSAQGAQVEWPELCPLSPQGARRGTAPPMGRRHLSSCSAPTCGRQSTEQLADV